MPVLDSGGGGSGRTCVSDREEWGDLFDTSHVSVEFCASSNSLELDIGLDGTTSAFLDEGQTVARASVDIKRERLEGIASEARSIIDRNLRDEFDIPSPTMIPGGASSFGRVNITVDDAPGGAVRVGEYSSSVSKRVSYNRPSIRVPPRVSQELPDTIGVDVTLSVSGFLDKWIRRVSPVTVSMEIPLDALVNIRVIDSNICSLRHPDLEEAAKTIQEVTRDRGSQFDTVRSTIDETYEEFNGFDSFPELGDFRGGESRLNTFRSRLENAVSSWERMEPEIGDGLRDALDTYERNISSADGECEEMFRNMTDGRLEKAREMAEEYPRMKNLAGNGRDLLGMEPPDRSGVGDTIDGVRDDLDKISNRIQTRVSNFRAAVEEFASTNFNRRNRERRNELINEGEELLSDIRSLKVGRPGRAEALGQVRASLNQLRRINAPSQGQVPCGDLHPDVDSAMENLEGFVENLDRDVGEEDLNTVENLEESVVERIEAMDDSRCEGRYIRRLRKENRRVDVLTSPIRVREEVMNQSRDRRQELIQQLISN